MIKRRSATLAPALLLGIVLLLEAPAEANAWDPFPKLPDGQRSAVKASLDQGAFSGLEGCLMGLDPASGARYFAAAVDVSSPDGSRSPDPQAAVEYSEALAQAWAGRLGPQDVLLVFAVRNRAVAVHAGRHWRNEGFAGEMADLTIAASGFGGAARDGRYGDAICQLAEDVEETLSSLPPYRARRATGERSPAFADDRARSEKSSKDGSSSWILIPLLLVGGAAFLLFLRRRRAARARVRAEAETQRWQDRLSSVADQLLALENEHPLYFTATERWTGESLEADRACARAVNHVYLLYSTAHELQARAQALIGTGGAWDPTPYDDAWRLLHEEKIDTELLDSKRLALEEEDANSAKDAFRGHSEQLLDEIGVAYRQAIDNLRAVSDIEKTFYAASERVEAASTAATEACGRRSEELDLPAAHLLERLGPALEDKKSIRLESMSDPLFAARRFDEISGELEDVARIAAAGNRIAEDLRGQTSERLNALEDRVAELRNEGFKLREPGFDPDLQIDRGGRQAESILRALAVGDEERAITEHARLGRDLEELGQMIDASVQARSSVPTQVDELASELAELARRRPAADRILQDLNARYAASAIDPAGDNLLELTPIESELSEALEQIRRDHEAQRYLSTLEDLTTCRRSLARGAALLDEIENVARRLEELRAQARDGLEGLSSRSDALRSSLAAAGVAAGLRDSGREAIDALPELYQASNEERPNWPELAGDVATALAELDDLQRRAEDQAAAHGRARELARGLEAQTRELERQARQETRDRAHVDRAVSEAAELFESWRRDLKADGLDGEELLERGAEVERRLAWADEIWRAEIDVIRRATAELRAAEAMIDRERGQRYGYGVRPQIGDARRLLSEARRLEGQKDWDQLLNLAHRTSEAAERAGRQARREAREREEAERRRLAAIERRRRARLAANLTQAALQAAASAAASAAISGSPRMGSPRPGGWRSAGTSRSGFGRRRAGGGGWGPRRGKGRKAGGGGW